MNTGALGALGAWLAAGFAAALPDAAGFGAALPDAARAALFDAAAALFDVAGAALFDATGAGAPFSVHTMRPKRDAR